MKTLSLKKLTLFLFIIFSVNQIFAQTDDNVYSRGQCYYADGIKHAGFINYNYGEKKIRFKIDSLSRDHQNVDIKTFKSLVIYRSVKNKKSEKDTANQINPNAVKETTPIEQPKMVADSFVVLNVTVDNPDYPIEIQLGKFLVEGAQGKIYSRDDQFTASQTGGVGTGFVSVGLSYSYIKTYYMCEISGKVFELHRGNFMGLLFAAFSDDQDLLEKINTKKYRFGDLGTIIDEYKKFKKQ